MTTVYQVRFTLRPPIVCITDYLLTLLTLPTYAVTLKYPAI